MRLRFRLFLLDVTEYFSRTRNVFRLKEANRHRTHTQDDNPEIYVNLLRHDRFILKRGGGSFPSFPSNIRSITNKRLFKNELTPSLPRNWTLGCCAVFSWNRKMQNTKDFFLVRSLDVSTEHSTVETHTCSATAKMELEKKKKRACFYNNNPIILITSQFCSSNGVYNSHVAVHFTNFNQQKLKILTLLTFFLVMIMKRIEKEKGGSNRRTGIGRDCNFFYAQKFSLGDRKEGPLEAAATENRPERHTHTHTPKF